MRKSFDTMMDGLMIKSVNQKTDSKNICSKKEIKRLGFNEIHIRSFFIQNTGRKKGVSFNKKTK